MPTQQNSIGISVSSTGVVTLAGNISIPNGSGYIFSTQGRISSPADGVFLLRNNALTGYTGLKLGGTTSSFPYLKVNGAGIDFRLADDSGATAISASTVTGTVLSVSTSTTTDGFVLQNTTAAAVGAQQYSPLFRMTGFGWGTTAGTSQECDWITQVQPVQSTVPTSNWILSSQIAGGGYTARITVASGGTITLGGTTNVSGSVSISAGSTYGWSGRGTLSSPAANSVQLGVADAASPAAQTLSCQSVVTGTSNTNGVNCTFTGSKGTGTGVGGSLIFQTSAASTTGSTPNALATVLTLDSTKLATFTGAVTISAPGTVTGSAVTTDGTQTLTNKRWTPRVVTVADATSLTPAGDTTDLCYQLNTQGTGTLTVNAPTGTPVDGQLLTLRLKSTNVQTFSMNAIYAGSTDLALPTVSTGSSKVDTWLFMYQLPSTKWQLMAKNFGLT